jgi:hypothetical protein
MDSLHYRVFHGFLGRESIFAISSADEMKRMLEKMFGSLPPEENAKTVNTFWYSVDAFLMSTGNISKTFWPSPWDDNPIKDKIMRRGQELREILGIKDESMFNAKNRTMRNDFEHFDERLDEWFFQSEKQPVLIDSSIVPYQTIESFKGLSSHILRTFDQYSWILHYRKHELDFRKMIVAIQELQTSLDAHVPRFTQNRSRLGA